MQTQPQATEAPATQRPSAGGSGQRRVSKSSQLQMQRDIFEEKFAVMSENQQKVWGLSPYGQFFGSLLLIGRLLLKGFSS